MPHRLSGGAVRLDAAVGGVLLRLGALAAGAVILAVGVMVWRSVVFASVDRETSASQALDLAHAGMLDQETGLRAWVQTRQAVFLDPFGQGQGETAAGDARLMSQIQGEAQLTADATAMEGAQQQWTTQWAVPAAQQAPDGSEAFLARGKQLFDTYRATEAALSAALAERSQSGQQFAGRLAYAGVSAEMLLGVAGATLWVRWRRRLRRAVIGPVVCILDAMERIEAGDYSPMQPTADAPAELQAIERRVSVLAAAVGRARAQEAQRADEAERQALTDALTQLPNRRALEQQLAIELERARRHRRPLAVAVVDLDGFKQVNDLQGHARGDALLQDAALTIRGNLRSADSVYRQGGDEFLVVMPETALAQAVEVCERLRSAVRGSKEVRDRVTLSVGVAAIPDNGVDAVALLGAADRALYAAKAGGRDRVRVAPSRRAEADSKPR